MHKKVGVLLVALVLCASTAFGQSDDNKLATLIFQVFGPEGLFVESEAVLPSGATHSAHFNSAFQSEFTKINLALPLQLLTAPLPSPASGFTYSLDPELGVPTRSTQSFGPILAERAETIGKGRVSFGFAYQYFGFSTIDGLDLEAIPAVFTHDGAQPGGKADVVTTVNSISANTNRFTTFLTYGLHDRVDLSVAVPLVSTELAVTSLATVQRVGTSENPAVHFFENAAGGFGDNKTFSARGSASGVGDIIVRLKGTVAEFGSTGIAAGANVRLPTGDEMNLLGVGGPGFAPFFVASFVLDRVTPHVNLAYEWNGESVLAGDPVTGDKGDLPDQFIYTLGFDVGVNENFTLIFDFLGRRVIDAAQLTTTQFQALDGTSTFDNIGFEEGSFNIADAAVGVKLNTYGDLLIDFNVIFKLNDGGMRARVSPLLGVEYSF